MAEIAGLATSLADRILEQHEAGIPISAELFRMLVRAARMLLDSGVTWPPSVEHVIMEVAKRVEEAKAASANPQAGSRGDDVMVHLTQGLKAAKRT
jgi:hypothetical protein